MPPADWNDSEVDDSEDVQGAAACVTVSCCAPIAIVPVLVVPAGLAATRYVAVPFPEPDAPVSIVIHETPGTAVHAQPEATLTLTLPSSPAAAMFWVVGVSVMPQAAPACVITNDCPATVSVAERELLAVFAATLYPIVALPVPDEGVVNVTHDGAFCVFQKHPSPDVTAIVPLLAEAGSDALVGEMAYPHPANCVTVTAWPATVSTPERGDCVGFGSAEYVTVPEPVPLAPFVIVNHDTELDAVQAQPACVVTFTVAVAPAPATDGAVGDTV